MPQRQSGKAAIEVTRRELFMLQDAIDDAFGDCALGRRLHALTGEERCRQSGAAATESPNGSRGRRGR